MKPPIFVYEPADLSVFDEVWKAERYIEPPDVKEGIYFFYDSEGLVLESVVIKDDRGIEQCVIKKPQEETYIPDKLKSIIIDNLECLGEIYPRLNYSRSYLENLELRELVLESLKYSKE